MVARIISSVEWKQRQPWQILNELTFAIFSLTLAVLLCAAGGLLLQAVDELTIAKGICFIISFLVDVL